MSELGPNPEPAAEPPVGGAPSNDERNLAMLAHLLGGLGAVLGGVVGFVGPLVIWLMKKEESAWVAEEAREALNFQITLLIIYAVAIAIAAVTCGFGALLLAVPWILQVIFGIVAAITASKGEPYRYPFNIRLVT